MEESNVESNAKFQFSITTAFCVITAIAIICNIARWEQAFPYWTILPGIFFVAFCFVARWYKLPELAWGLFTIAWLVALIDVVDCLIRSFQVIDGSPPVSVLQHGYLLAYGSTLALPFFLSLPAVYLAIKVSKGSRSYARKWIIVCSIVGLIDVTLLTVWLILFIGYTWPR